MSEALFKHTNQPLVGLRFWTESEILVREQAIQTLRMTLGKALQRVNPAWVFHRIEGPTLTPRAAISAAYDETDIFLLQSNIAGAPAALRAETTASSYLYAQHLMKSGMAKPPLCVWQTGKSYRQETNDGARPSELRYNEFYQAEFQCIYPDDTKADYRAEVTPRIAAAIRDITVSDGYQIIDSDRLPEYSLKTVDVEVMYGRKMKEMCSISTRKDYLTPGYLVLEVAVGLDRLVAVHQKNTVD